jgi:AcrR family transcriptional regulator
MNASRAEDRRRGSYKVSGETSRRLLDAALDLFGRQGFRATSVRQLADEAKVALPAIAYHFTDKAGLHRACAIHVIKRYRERMGPLIDELGDLAAVVTPESANAALTRVTLGLSATLLSRDAKEPWAAFMMREMQVGGPAYDLMLERLWLPGLNLIAGLISRTRGRTEVLIEDKVIALHLLSGLNWQGGARKVAEDFLGRSLETIDEDIIAGQLALLINAISAGVARRGSED